jgi:hypothetical protein
MENQPIFRKSKPPYLLGLLCLIPLIGAFVGLGLLIVGIVQYKDKWLIIIGSFGILFTVIIYSSIFLFFRYGKFPKEGFAKISQVELNRLVKDVEFYKLQNGHYPDSLQQLLEDDKLISINDQTQGFWVKPQKTYNYKRVGEKYLLFSSGIDGIPYTKDDLFPTIELNDSSKVGFLKSN